eukprot:GHVH01002685.1.p1 GENE.GHVH01002685.1~~GHVH01002685.1.p1  ORF type:complete len:117 (-),score=13.36 GHVH01002685.1:122-472(-)
MSTKNVCQSQDGWTVVKSKRSPQAVLKEKILASRVAMLAMRSQMVQMCLIRDCEGIQSPPEANIVKEGIPHQVGQLQDRCLRFDRISKRQRTRLEERKRRGVRNHGRTGHKKPIKP